ncbi:hypothetical protein ABK046_52495, partial [Streptomyces caeruleatus]
YSLDLGENWVQSSEFIDNEKIINFYRNGNDIYAFSESNIYVRRYYDPVFLKINISEFNKVKQIVIYNSRLYVLTAEGV